MFHGLDGVKREVRGLEVTSLVRLDCAKFRGRKTLGWVNVFEVKVRNKGMNLL